MACISTNTSFDSRISACTTSSDEACVVLTTSVIFVISVRVSLSRCRSSSVTMPLNSSASLDTLAAPSLMADDADPI